MVKRGEFIKQLREKKECKDCAYYVRHYTVYGKKFSGMFFGHCTCSQTDTAKGLTLIRSFKRACQFYEDRTLVVQARKGSAREMIENMEISLQNMARILIDEEEN